jgi:hypothetical protein
VFLDDSDLVPQMRQLSENCPSSRKLAAQRGEDVREEFWRVDHHVVCATDVVHVPTILPPVSRHASKRGLR